MRGVRSETALNGDFHLARMWDLIETYAMTKDPLQPIPKWVMAEFRAHSKALKRLHATETARNDYDRAFRLAASHDRAIIDFEELLRLHENVRKASRDE